MNYLMMYIKSDGQVWLDEIILSPVSAFWIYRYNYSAINSLQVNNSGGLNATCNYMLLAMHLLETQESKDKKGK